MAASNRINAPTEAPPVAVDELLREAFRGIARQAVERERRDEPLEVRELRRLKPDSTVLRFFSRKAS